MATETEQVTTERPVPHDSPLWRAWEAYQKTATYANARRWARESTHVDGSLWAAYSRGFMDAAALACTDTPEVPHA